MAEPRAVTGHSGCISRCGTLFWKDASPRVASRRIVPACARTRTRLFRDPSGYEAAKMGHAGSDAWSEPSCARGAARWVERPPEESASAAFRGTNEDDRAERPARALAPSITADRISRTMNESLARLAFSVSRRGARTGVATPRRRAGTSRSPEAAGRARAHRFLSRPDIREPARTIP